MFELLLFVLLAPTSDMLPAKVSQLSNGGIRVEYTSSFVGEYVVLVTLY